MPKKIDYIKSGKKRAKLIRRREEAAIRNEKWQDKTLSERLANLDSRKLVATKQRKRIAAKSNKA